MAFLLKLLPSLVVCVGGGWWTGLISRKGIKEWYPGLTKPRGTPPNLVFPIVWTSLYTLMAIAVTLLWESDNHRPKHTAFLWFAAQLALNFAWSWLFFYLRRIDLALLDIVVLWFSIYRTYVSFSAHTLWGSYLLLPYLAWVSYASYLNLFIWFYN